MKEHETFNYKLCLEREVLRGLTQHAFSPIKHAYIGKSTNKALKMTHFLEIQFHRDQICENNV